MTPAANSTPGAEFGKKAIRFGVTVVSLLLLRALVAALPMLKTASAIGTTFLSPLVLVNAAVDTLLLIAILTFGSAVSGVLRETCPRAPDLTAAAQMAILALVLVLAYNMYQVPIACLLVSPQDAFAGPADPAAAAAGAQLGVGDMFSQIRAGMGGQLAQILKNVSGDVLAGYQKLGVVRLRQSPDWYGWTFLALCIFPLVRLVMLGSRNLDAISELLFHKATAQARGRQPNGAVSGPPTQGNHSGAPSFKARDLSREEVDQLVQFKRLLDQGAISQDEFNARKKELMRGSEALESPEMLRLKDLLDTGVFTQEEYEAQRDLLMSRQ